MEKGVTLGHGQALGGDVGFGDLHCPFLAISMPSQSATHLLGYSLPSSPQTGS